VPIYFKAKLIAVDCATTDAASLVHFDWRYWHDQLFPNSTTELCRIFIL